MKRIVLCSLLVLLLVAGAALAEDFWVKKEYMQWSEEEVKTVMTDSPWAKDVTVSAPMSSIGGRGQPRDGEKSAAPDVENPAPSSGRPRRTAGGGDEGDGGGRQGLLTLNISWRSALPYRKAVVRSRLGAGKAIPPEAQELVTANQADYVIVVSGVPAGMASSLSAANMERSTIRAGKKPAVTAKAMDLQRHTRTVDIIYVFPKTQSITPDDKEIEVVLRIGPVEAKKKFNLKDMVYDGKLEM